MSVKLSLLAPVAVACALSIPCSVGAEPLKIGFNESYSGPIAPVGKMVVDAGKFAIDLLNAAGGFNGQPIQVVEYDNESTSTGASTKFKQSAADGVHIIIQGGGSGVAGQLTEDIKKHNQRNKTKPIIYLNTSAQASELTGEKCHFYHFSFSAPAPMRVNALVRAMQEAGELGKRVYSINQNYSWGADVENAIVLNSKLGGYEVIEKVLHEVNKIQDFAPFAAKIKAANVDTVLTGNWSNDLLLLMKATGDAGLKVRFGTLFLDQPGSLANAGSTAVGHYLANMNSSDSYDQKINEDYKKRYGHFPIFAEPQAYQAVMALGEALKKVDFKGGPVDVKAIALALENVSYKSPYGVITMRKDDHQAYNPIVVSKVTREAKFKADGTDMGFQTVKVVPGAEAIFPVQASCKMERP